MKRDLEQRYRRPLRANIAIVTLVLWTVYLLIMLGANSASVSGAIKLHGRGSNTVVTTMGFKVALTVFSSFIYLQMVVQYRSRNRHYLKDAASGRIVKERMHITKVFDTPAGINIYYLDSAEIRTFTPDPYRIFHEGDSVVIYYLEHSLKYLAYEPAD